MHKKLDRGPHSLPHAPIDPDPTCAASVFTIHSLLRQMGDGEAGHPPELALWTRFLRGEGPPPVNPEISGDPEIVGQLLASFIINNDRRRAARQHGRDHEIRSALGETVSALSSLVAEVASVRTDANAVLNQLADYLGTRPGPDDSDQEAESALLQLRSIVRKLDVCANEKRRAVNSRLANLRMELLELPLESETAFRTPRSVADIEAYLQRYAEAARQLGESLSVIVITSSTENEDLTRESVLVSVADSINGSFKREVDFISRLGGNQFVAILIDTPEAAIRDLLSRLQSRIEADFPAKNLSEHLHVQINAVNTDSTLAKVSFSLPHGSEDRDGSLLCVASAALSDFVVE